MITALNTGMRKREILDLTKDDVDLKNRIIHVTHTKNWEVRDIPMNEVLTSILKEVINKGSKNMKMRKRRDGRVVEGGGLENRFTET